MLKVSKDVELVCKDKDTKKGLCKDIYKDDRYFIRRLQRHDKKFHSDKKEDAYGRICQTLPRQPVVLKYNPEKKKSIKRDSFTESLKFGDKYYICPKYWCPFCEVPVSESDIDKRTVKIKKISGYASYKRAKCPYCNEKIYVKESIRDDVSSVYSYPGLLDKKKLPCCFSKPRKA